MYSCSFKGINTSLPIPISAKEPILDSSTTLRYAKLKTVAKGFFNVPIILSSESLYIKTSIFCSTSSVLPVKLPFGINISCSPSVTKTPKSLTLTTSSSLYSPSLIIFPPKCSFTYIFLIA
ncbi:hypothetical protein D3C73_1028960 [compost metagenome]